MPIKNWFLEKNGFTTGNIDYIQQNNYDIARETEKAVLIRWGEGKRNEMWVPKSCLIDQWEKQKSSFAYHDYLVFVARNAYYTGDLGEPRMFRSGRNVYDGAAFIHQWKTKELESVLKYYNVQFLKKEEWVNR